MRVIQQTKENLIANVYIAETDDGRSIEFVESTQPPQTINEKWVIILSTLFGCPVDCAFCDAGGDYRGKLSVEHLQFQVDYLVGKRFPGNKIDTDKFKIQFARMGEPSFNYNVIEFLRRIPELYDYRLFIPSLSTIGPAGTQKFFEELLDVKKRLFDKEFQLQFSIHSTDVEQRKKLIPVNTMSFDEIASYGERFFSPGGKKLTLNFAIGDSYIVEAETLRKYFDPEKFLIKVTPVNPTFKAQKNRINSLISPLKTNHDILDNIRNAGYDILISIGELEENKIGSNCGQYVSQARNQMDGEESYTYALEKCRMQSPEERSQN